jgi:hypothetical protein
MENRAISLKDLISSLTKKIKSSCRDLSTSILDSIDSIEKVLNEKIINIVICGQFNSGKSTLISSLISIMTDQPENVILPTSELENTYYPTVVEASPDEKYHIMIQKINFEEKKESFSDPDQISKILNEFDKESEKNLHKLKHKQEIELDLIKVQIPNFPNNIRLIDSPGLTTDRFKNQIFKLLYKDYFYSIIVYLKSLNQPKEDTETFTFLEEIRKKYKYWHFCVCFTKYDKLFNKFYKKSKYCTKKDTKTEDLRKLIIKFVTFKKDVFKLSENLNISKIFVINNEGKTEHSKNQLKNFINSIKYLEENEGEEIKKVSFLNQFYYRLFDINQKYNEEKLFNEMDEKAFDETLNNSLIRFKSDINDWSADFYEKLNNEVVKNINSIDKNILNNEKFPNKYDYISRQIQELSKIFENKIDQDLKKIFEIHHKWFLEMIPESIIDKLRRIIKQDLNSCVNKEILNSFQSLYIPTGGIVISLIDLSAAIVLRYLPTFITPLGLGVSLAGLIYSIYSIRHHVGMWTRDECIKEIKEIFCNKLRDERNNIIKESNDKFKHDLNILKEVFKIKETLPEIKLIMDSLNDYGSTSDNNEHLIKINKIFQNGNNEFVESEDIKKFIEELFINDGKNYFK